MGGVFAGYWTSISINASLLDALACMKDLSVPIIALPRSFRWTHESSTLSSSIKVARNELAFIELSNTRKSFFMTRTQRDPSRSQVPASQNRAYVQSHRSCLSPSSLSILYGLSSGSFKIPSTSNRLRASSSAQVCIL